MLPVRGSIATSAASSGGPARFEPLDAGRDRALRGVLQRRRKLRVHPPVGRVVAAELVAELLAQVVLGPAGARYRRASDTAGCAAGRARAAASCSGGDEFLLAHPARARLAAFERAVVVGPRRQRRRRAQESGNQRGLRQRQVSSRACDRGAATSPRRRRRRRSDTRD